MATENVMNHISVSEVEFIPCRPHNGLIGFISCVLNNSIYCGGIALYTRIDGSGLRAVFPTKTLSSGKIIKIFYPVNKKMGDAFTHAVECKYLDMMNSTSKRKSGGENG